MCPLLCSPLHIYPSFPTLHFSCLCTLFFFFFFCSLFFTLLLLLQSLMQQSSITLPYIPHPLPLSPLIPLTLCDKESVGLQLCGFVCCELGSDCVVVSEYQATDINLNILLKALIHHSADLLTGPLL